MFSLSIWMPNSTFITGQCLNASHSNNPHSFLCHVKGTSKMYCFSVSIFVPLFLVQKSSLPETSFKTYILERAHFHTKVLIIFLQPCNLGALTLHKKCHVLYKNVQYRFPLQLQGEERKYKLLQQVPLMHDLLTLEDLFFCFHCICFYIRLPEKNQANRRCFYF